MSSARIRLQVGIAAAGILALLATFAFAFGSMRDTEATWNDKVLGSAQFGANQNAGQNHARALAGFGTIKRQVSSSPIGPARAEAGPSNRLAEVPLAHESAGAWAALPLRLTGSACAATQEDLAETCGALASLPAGSTYAASETSRLGLWAAGLEGIENLSYGADSRKAAFKTTATCRPGQWGETSITAGDSLVIRSDTRLHLPAPNHQTVASRDVATRTVKGVLQNHQSSGPGWAKAELRLYAQSDIALSGWTLHVVLASAECRLGGSAPTDLQRPTTSPPVNLPVSPNAPTGASALGRQTFHKPTAPVIYHPNDAETIDGEDGERVEVTPEETLASAAPATETSTPTSLAKASTTAPVSNEPSAPVTVPTEHAMPQPTEQTAVPQGPQQPESVREGREFAVVNRDGIKLGTATVEDIVRSPDCGVELTLSIATSAEAGPDRWASVGSDDFAEVRPGGSIREAKRMSSDCAQSANSRTTALSPGREYEIVIAFALDESAKQAMLRPDGTAGWMFDLPPLPRVSTTKPTPTTSPQAEAPTSSPSATTTAVAEETATATAEA